MKSHSNKSQPERGSSLLATLSIAMVLCITLGSSLLLVANQTLLTSRSQAWNTSLTVAEAGLEEALCHLNKNDANRATDGWALVGNTYVLTRKFGDSTYTISLGQGTSPEIIARAWTPMRAGFLLGAINGTVNEQVTIGRAVRVQAQKNGFWMRGLCAKERVRVTGNTETDSYDSEDPTWNTDGRYDPNKRRDNGDIATNGTFEKAIDTSGTVAIRGHVATGPKGTVGLVGQASVGSMAWHAAGRRGIEPTWFRDDMNVNWTDPSAPHTTGLQGMSGIVNGTNYAKVLYTGNYKLSSVNLSSTTKWAVHGNAVLYITGDMSMTGQSFIYLTPGSTLRIYLGGSANLTGQSLVNASGLPKDMSIFGLSTCTEISISGNGMFAGTIYAPRASVSLSGGGSDDLDFCGAGVFRTITMSGHFNFHYDESLGSDRPGIYTVNAWDEIAIN